MRLPLAGKHVLDRERVVIEDGLFSVGVLPLHESVDRSQNPADSFLAHVRVESPCTNLFTDFLVVGPRESIWCGKQSLSDHGVDGLGLVGLLCGLENLKKGAAVSSRLGVSM